MLGNYEEIFKSLRERDRSEAAIDVKQIPRRFMTPQHFSREV
jgi:hypothetical protein